MNCSLELLLNCSFELYSSTMTEPSCYDRVWQSPVFTFPYFFIYCNYYFLWLLSRYIPKNTFLNYMVISSQIYQSNGIASTSLNVLFMRLIFAKTLNICIGCPAMGASLKPLGTIVFCDVRGFWGGSKWGPMMPRQSLGRL